MISVTDDPPTRVISALFAFVGESAEATVWSSLKLCSQPILEMLRRSTYGDYVKRISTSIRQFVCNLPSLDTWQMQPLQSTLVAAGMYRMPVLFGTVYFVSSRVHFRCSLPFFWLMDADVTLATLDDLLSLLTCFLRSCAPNMGQYSM